MIPIVDLGLSIIDKIIPDKEAAAKAKIELMKVEQSGDLEVLKSKTAIIVAEANSEHFIVAAWRPITMLVFTAVIANNYLIYPYLSLFWTEAPQIDVPEEIWELFKICMGGYVVARSGEKMFNKFVHKKAA